MIQAAHTELSEAIKAWVKAGKQHKALEVLKGLDPFVVGAITLETMFDMASRGAKRGSIICTVGNRLRDETMFSSMQRQHAPLAKRLRKISPNRRRHQAIKWIRLGLFDHNHRVTDGQAQAGLVAVELALLSGLFRMGKAGLKGAPTVHLTPETENWIAHSHKAHEILKPTYMPMLDEPLDWGPDQVGGYRTSMARRKPLVRTQRREHTHRLHAADMPEVYDAVNIVQRTRWQVNQNILAVATELWSTNAATILPEREPPVIPEWEDTDEWKRNKRKVLREWEAEQANRMRVSRVLSMASRETSGFYLPVHLDFRGRLYPVPPFLNYQGDDLARGLMEFSDFCMVTPGSQAQTLWMTHGEDLRGTPLDTDELAAIYNDPLDCQEWMDAEKPWQFLAWALDYGAWLDDPHHPIRTPVHLDGSNNGLQIYALLLRDPVLAKATNVLAGPRRDIYQEVADLAWAGVLADDSDLAREWIAFCPGGLPRKAAKRPVMTLPYGCTEYSCMRYLMEWVEAECAAKKDFRWGYGIYKPCSYMAKRIWDAIHELAGNAVACMDWLQAVSDEASGPLRWTSPTGFPVTQDYPKNTSRRLRSVVADTIKWVTINRGHGATNTRRQRNGVAPNFVHSLDSAALHKAIVLAHGEGVHSFAPIHDDFAVLPSDAPAMHRAIRTAYAEIFSENVLADFHRECSIYTDAPAPPPIGDLDPRCVIDSEYFFA